MIKQHKLLITVIAQIDAKIAALTNVIIHTASFMQLEASWRGLSFLVKEIPMQATKKIAVRLLPVSVRELCRDCNSATDVEQMVIFDKVYTEEYDRPGGIPFAILLADYFVDIHDKKTDWITITSMLGKVAAASFAVLLLGLAANFFEIDAFNDLNENINLARTFSQIQYTRWHKLRTQEDMRFVHYLLPRVLMRRPYQQNERYLANHGFSEKINSIADYCWGNPGYVVAAMILKCFLRTSWFTELRAEKIKLPAMYMASDTAKLFPISRLEACISDKLETELAASGFFALMEQPYMSEICLRSCHSIHKVSGSGESAVNAFVATMLPYLLCASRFAHYLKIISRDKVGSFYSASQYEKLLQKWIYNYCGQASVNNASQLARYPLRDAKIKIMQAPVSPGKYLCKMELQPNYYIEKVSTKLRFISTIAAE